MTSPRGRALVERRPGARWRFRQAFTLIEVAVASAIMALALFGFISVCSTALKSAKSLNRVEVDASSLAAELSLSNRLEEMSDHGDFGKLYPGYQWSRSVYEVGTNGLFRADFVIVGGPKGSERRMSVLYFPKQYVQGAGR
jgi:prepilin-type N-terminal cleavage/methylation domain-containing protein